MTDPRSSPPSPETPRLIGMLEEFHECDEGSKGYAEMLQRIQDLFAASPRSSLTAPTELKEALNTLEARIVDLWSAKPREIARLKDRVIAARSKVEEIFKALRDENERLRKQNL